MTDQTFNSTTSYFVSLIGYSVGIVISLAVLVYHHIRVYQDLCTKQRNSVKHLQRQPELTRLYKAFNWFIHLSIFFYFLTSFGFLYALVFVPDYEDQARGDEACTIVSLNALLPLHGAKLFMYWSFTLRLELDYGHGIYSHQVRTLFFIATFAGVMAFIFIGLECTYVTAEYVEVDESFTNYCDYRYPEWLAGFNGTVDTCLFIAYWILFIVPFNKLRKQLHDTENKNPNAKQLIKRAIKLMYVAMKLGILTSVILVLGIITSIFVVITNGSLLGIYWGITSLCLSLMSHYYNDEVYYERFCGCCIAMYLVCCKQDKYNRTERTGSIDTFMILQDIQKIGSNNVTGTENELAEIVSANNDEPDGVASSSELGI